MFLVSQRWLAVDVLLDVFSLVIVLTDPVMTLFPVRLSLWLSKVVGLADGLISCVALPWTGLCHR